MMQRAPQAGHDVLRCAVCDEPIDLGPESRALYVAAWSVLLGARGHVQVPLQAVCGDSCLQGHGA